MKILIQVSAYSYKTYHFLAKRITERYPESEFAIIGNNKHGKDFFINQNDIQYTYFDDTSDDKIELKEGINFDIIKCTSLFSG